MKALKSADYNRKLVTSELKGLTLSLPVVITYAKKSELECHNRDTWLNDKRNNRHEINIIFDVPTHSAHEFVLAIH